MTDLLGTDNSTLNNIVLGLGAGGSSSSVYTASVNESLFYTSNLTVYNLLQHITESITLSDSASAVKLKIADIIFLAEVTKAWNLSQSINNSITFTDQLSAFNLNRPVFDTITFTDSALGLKLRLTESLTFVESVFTYNVNVFATSTITYSDSSTNVLLRLEDDLIFDDIVVGTTLVLSDIFSLNESSTYVAIRDPSISESIAFSDNVYRILPEIISESTSFTETYSVDKINPGFDVLEPFDFISVTTEIATSASDVFSLTEIIIGDASIPIIDSYSLADSWTAINSKGVSDSFVYTDSTNVNKTLSKKATDNLTYVESKTLNRSSQLSSDDNINLLDSTKVTRIQFASIIDTTIIIDELIGLRHDEDVSETINFDSAASSIKIAVGKSPDDLNLIDSNSLNTLINFNLNDEFIPRELAFAITADKYLMLIGVNKAIALPPPEFNDNYATQQKTIFKRMMDASLRTYNKTSDNEKIHYDFVITRIQADNLREFLDSENGNFINLIDWRGYRYRVKLLTDSVNFEESGRWEPCGNKVRTSMEFLGKRCMT